MWIQVAYISCIFLACHAQESLYVNERVLQEYLTTERMLLNVLKREGASQLRHFSEYKQDHEEAIFEVPNVLGVYLIVKRLNVDWMNLVVDNDLEGSELSDVLEMFPTAKNLTEAAWMLLRVQRVFKMAAEELARGEIQGERYTRAMSSSDCLWLATEAALSPDSTLTASWLTESLRLHDDEVVNTTDRWDVLTRLSTALFKADDFHKALEVVEEMLRSRPANVKMMKFRTKVMTAIRDSEDVDDIKNQEAAYKQLCRGIVPVITNLSCRYVTHDLPYLLIGPLKQEVVSPLPILIYHDVLYDSEIAVLQRLAEPQLEMAEVYDLKDGGSVKSDRVASLAWLNDDEDKVVEVVMRRSAVIAGGLSETTAEALQVASYDAGGHYFPHHDYSDDVDEINNEEEGNRVATLIYYLDAVERGGATVFPVMGAAVRPSRGTALFWYNLRDDGEGDTRTLHAACPVLVGRKWIANRWFHERGQEFIRPCPRRNKYY